MTRHLTALGGVAMVVMFSVPAAGQDLNIGALPKGSPAHGIAIALAGVVGDNSNLSLRAVAFERASAALSMVDQGKLTMAVASAIDANFAVQGSKYYQGRKLSDLRILARLMSYRAGFVVRRGSDIRSIADFKGRRFPTGMVGHNVLDYLARAAFATEGMSFKDVSGVPVESFMQTMSQLVAGRIEGSFIAPASRVAREADASVKIRFVSIKQSPRTAAVVRRIAPGAFFAVVSPARRRSFIEKPITMLGVDYLLLVGSKVPARVAYETVKTLYLGRKGLIARHRMYRGFATKLMSKKGLGLAYHPGAIKFYDEAGIW